MARLACISPRTRYQLHALGVPDKEIQVRHSNIAVTQSCYIKALTESQVSAMELVGEEFESGRIN